MYYEGYGMEIDAVKRPMSFIIGSTRINYRGRFQAWKNDVSWDRNGYFSKFSLSFRNSFDSFTNLLWVSGSFGFSSFRVEAVVSIWHSSVLNRLQVGIQDWWIVLVIMSGVKLHCWSKIALSFWSAVLRGRWPMLSGSLEIFAFSLFSYIYSPPPPKKKKNPSLEAHI